MRPEIYKPTKPMNIRFKVRLRPVRCLPAFALALVPSMPAACSEHFRRFEKELDEAENEVCDASSEKVPVGTDAWMLSSKLRARRLEANGKSVKPIGGAGGIPRRSSFRKTQTLGAALKPATPKTELHPSIHSRKVVFADAFKKAALLLFSAAALLAGGAASVRGQSALDGFDPNANGTISVVVVQPDGKILLGGSFTTVLGVTRNHIARLNPDGTLDTIFNPNANGDIFAIAVQADGQVLAGGYFGGANSIGGQARNFIARLDATTGLADSFNPNPNLYVYAIVVQPDGKILVGGDFAGANSIGGTNRNYIARLDPATSLADSFNPNANATVFAIAIQADGKVLAGGSFGSIGGTNRNYIARLDPTTGLADSFNPAANLYVRSIALQADGKVLVGGQFSGANSIGGAARNRIARLDPMSGLADSFDPNANGPVFSIAVQADGKILAGGYFNGVNSIGGATRNYIARLNPITGLADAFDPSPTDIVQSIAVQQDGKVLAGGNFANLAPNGGAAVQRNHIARMETDGGLDRTLDLNIVGNFVLAIAVQPDGKTLIGGGFTQVLGVPRANIARLNPDGSLDTAFNPNANGSVHAIAVQADGKILVGGEFHGANSIGGQTRNYIARLDTTGAIDSFNPNANSFVFTIAVQADGMILVGGDFSITIGVPSIGGAPRNRIARLDPTTGTADSFDPGANDIVNCIAVQANGQILVGGEFAPNQILGGNSIGFQPRNHIARVDATTGDADSFNPDASSSVGPIAVQADGGILVGGSFTNINGSATRRYIARLDPTNGYADAFDPYANGLTSSVAVQADGKVLAGGQFSNIGGQTRHGIARLGATTGTADSFDPDITNASYSVSALAVAADGKILAGGQFSNMGGQTRNLFARLSNATAALQNLAVAQTAITWTHGESILILSNSTTLIRGGSGPQCSRVTFESSTNGVNYSPLGSGAASGIAWTLTGLSLPTGQNLYIRARGYYRSGYLNGSESITESVRNVFLTPSVAPPPFLSIQRSANTNVVLSWATNFTGFTLEANTNLTSNVWSTVSPAPLVSGTNNAVTNAVSGSMRFYRLRK
jgi:uncharacterized delta-60 repeat protein